VTAPYANPVNSVSFYDGATLLATVPLTNGFATYTTTTLPVGADPITAVYPASLNFAASTSAILTEQINPLIPRFVITVTPNPIDIVVNTSGTVTVTVTELDGFYQPVQLSCTGLPIETNCIFAQTLIPAGGGTIQANITPAPPHSCKAGIADVPTPSGPLSGLWMAVVALSLLFARRRRRLLQGLTLAAALFFLPSINGCGNCTDLGLEPGTYTVTVLGTSTGTPVQTSSAVVTMNVSY
jgi:MYXO-CTERM domain-containing protein